MQQPRSAFYELGCLGMQSKMRSKLLLKLNIGTRLIANKYREGKMKSTLKRMFIVCETIKREAHGIRNTLMRLRQFCLVTCIAVIRMDCLCLSPGQSFEESDARLSNFDLIEFLLIWPIIRSVLLIRSNFNSSPNYLGSTLRLLEEKVAESLPRSLISRLV